MKLNKKMKTLLVTLFAASLSLAAFSTTGCRESDGNNPPLVQNDTIPTTIAFEETDFQFGQIPQNIPVKHVFTFTNTGKTDLVLKEVKPSCHCTTPEWTQDPIKPGEKGSITVEFDAKAMGAFKKAVTVTANTDPQMTILKFNGEVITPGQ